MSLHIHHCSFPTSTKSHTLTSAYILAHSKALSLYNLLFLLLERYDPNVVKRSIWEQCKKLRTDRRPATSDRRPTDLSRLIGEISNGHISVRARPIHFMFGSTVRFSGSADRMALFPVSPNPRWRLGRHLGKFKWRYLSGGLSDLLRFVLGWGFQGRRIEWCYFRFRQTHYIRGKKTMHKE